MNPTVVHCEVVTLYDLHVLQFTITSRSHAGLTENHKGPIGRSYTVPHLLGFGIIDGARSVTWSISMSDSGMDSVCSRRIFEAHPGVNNCVAGVWPHRPQALEGDLCNMNPSAKPG